MNAPLPAPAPAAALPGSSDAEMLRALRERIVAAHQRSTSELLQELRRAFPDSPLAFRVRALEALRQR